MAAQDGGEVPASGAPQVGFEAADPVREVNLGAVGAVEVVEEHASAGVVGGRTMGSFVAFARVFAGREVTVEAVGGRSVAGVLVAVATDHLLVRTRSGADVAVACAGVAAVSVAGGLFGL